MSAMRHSRVIPSTLRVLPAALLVMAGVAFGAGGDLDPGFGRDGRVDLDDDLGLDQHLAISRSRGFVQQPGDGKLLLAASYDVTARHNNDSTVVRLNPDGTPDESFGDGGVVARDFSDGFETSVALVLQRDGRIVVASLSTERNGGAIRLHVWRLNADGSPDPAFNGSGRTTLELGSGSLGIFGTDLVADPDGRLVVMSAIRRDGQLDVLFARLLADGALDPRFGTGPAAGTTLVDSGLSDEPRDLLRQSDGKWLACGRRRVEFAKNADEESLGMLAVRLTSEGALDTSFGDQGIWRLPAGRGTGAVDACTQLRDGKIMMAGHTGSYGAPSPVVVRLQSDGVLDPNFGIRAIPYDGAARLTSLLPLPDGSLMVVGDGSPRAYPHASDAIVVHIDAQSGSLDRDFGQRGVASVDFGRSKYLASTSTGSKLRQADGKLVLAATTHLTEDGWESRSSVSLARLLPDGPGHAGILGFAPVMDVVFEEESGEALIEVRRTGGSMGSAFVDYETSSGTAVAPEDFTAVRGSLRWGDGDAEPKTIRVPLTDDSIADNSEVFHLRLTNSSTTRGWSQRWVTIVDRDATAAPPPTVVNGASTAATTGAASPSSARGGGGRLQREIVAMLAALILAVARSRRGTQRRNKRSAT